MKHKKIFFLLNSRWHVARISGHWTDQRSSLRWPSSRRPMKLKSVHKQWVFLMNFMHFFYISCFKGLLCHWPLSGGSTLVDRAKRAGTIHPEGVGRAAAHSCGHTHWSASIETSGTKSYIISPDVNFSIQFHIFRTLSVHQCIQRRSVAMLWALVWFSRLICERNGILAIGFYKEFAWHLIPISFTQVKSIFFQDCCNKL